MDVKDVKDMKLDFAAASVEETSRSEIDTELVSQYISSFQGTYTFSAIPDFDLANFSTLKDACNKRNLPTTPEKSWISNLIFHPLLTTSDEMTVHVQRAWMLHILYENEIQNGIRGWNAWMMSDDAVKASEKVKEGLREEALGVLSDAVQQMCDAEVKLLDVRTRAFVKQIDGAVRSVEKWMGLELSDRTRERIFACLL